jgi:hypothetical protein
LPVSGQTAKPRLDRVSSLASADAPSGLVNARDDDSASSALLSSIRARLLCTELPDGQISSSSFSGKTSPLRKNNLLRRSPKSTLEIPPSCTRGGAYRDRHGRWVRDAVDAGCAADERAPSAFAKAMADLHASPTEAFGAGRVADGKAVWS